MMRQNILVSEEIESTVFPYGEVAEWSNARLC